ncbi:MAG: hydroxysqualene dehydroxylase HpnE [Hylemonella sp.]
MKVAVIGAGWAGLAAAVYARQAGHEVDLFEATRTLGGRARSLNAQLPNGQTVELDNGQHILIGAYQETLTLLQSLGVSTDSALLRQPLALIYPDGRGLQLPDLASPLDLLLGLASSRGWRWSDRWSLLRTALQWKRASFSCPAHLSVSELASPLGPRILHDLIEPLCLSALNTPTDQASAQVFLRVLQDGLFNVQGGSNLLLPRVPMGKLLPSAAHDWLLSHGARTHLGMRIRDLRHQSGQWHVEGLAFDAVLLATPVRDSCRLVGQSMEQQPPAIARALKSWIDVASELRFEAITTVYAWSPGLTLSRPMLALSSSDQAPAQFVFDRGQLDGPPGLLAFVISASRGERAELQSLVIQQANEQLGIQLTPVLTVTEKLATFACLPNLHRPAGRIAAGLLACGDYVQGPYPATLEGALRNAKAAVLALEEEMR